MKWLEKKNILLISPEAWGSNFVSKHHYAVTLSKQGNVVYFLNPPSESFSVQSTSYENLKVVNYLPFIKGLRYLPNLLQRFFIRQKYKRLQRLANCAFDIVWSFDNSVFYDFSDLPDSVLKISHIVDLNQNFETVKAANTANICFCTTAFIKEKLRTYNSRVFKIHHGYSIPSKLSQSRTILPGNNTTKVVYMGNLAIKYIDWELLQTVIRQHLNVDFIFIGPEGNSNLNKSCEKKLGSAQVKADPNTYFIGPIPSSKINAYLQKADILLITYQADLYEKQLASPHKFMDYFGSGKVIVATYTDEYKDKRELLAMSRRNKEYPALFSEVANNLSEWNCRTKQEERKQFAQDNSYEKQLERIEKIIQDAVPSKKILTKSVH